jgi:hypothetical protein
MARRTQWEYLVGQFRRRGHQEMWFECSHHDRWPVRGGNRGFADVLNKLGDEGWELVHVDDSAPRVVMDAGADSVFAWGDMIFKRPR